MGNFKSKKFKITQEDSHVENKRESINPVNSEATDVRSSSVKEQNEQDKTNNDNTSNASTIEILNDAQTEK